MVQITCTRSGLVFEAENRRRKVHPEISWYTAHSDMVFRYKAIEVIERGKAEGWDTLEKFESEIKKALSPPPPPPEPPYDFEGSWVARIIGSHEKYRFQREFLPSVSVKGRFKRFNVAGNGDGLFEACYQSAKGNESRHYYRIVSGRCEEISLSQAEEIFPLPDPTLLKVEEWFSQGKNVEYRGGAYFVERCDSWESQEDAWDDLDDEWVRRTVTKSVSFLRPLSAEAADRFFAEKAEEEKQKRSQEIAAAYLKRAVKDIISAHKGATVSPHGTAYPSGLSFVVEQGYYQPNLLAVLQKDGEVFRLWTLRYNGRDGDDWRFNNVAGAWAGKFVAVSPSFACRFQEIVAVAKGEACPFPGIEDFLSLEQMALSAGDVAGAGAQPDALAEQPFEPAAQAASKSLSKRAQAKIFAQFRREARDVKRAMTERMKAERAEVRRQKAEAKRKEIAVKGWELIDRLIVPGTSQHKKIERLRRQGTYAEALRQALDWLDANLPAVAARVRAGAGILEDAAIYYLTQIKSGVGKFFACCVATNTVSCLSVRQEARKAF